MGSIPKNKTRESILEDFSKVTGLKGSTFLCRHLASLPHVCYWVWLIVYLYV